EGGQWGPGRTVRAEVIVALLLGAHSVQPGAVGALTLAGARISGRINLAGARIDHPLWFEDCWFEQDVSLFGAETRTVAITGSRVPGLEAGSARIEGRLDLLRSTVETAPVSAFHREISALSLTHAHVTGGVILNGAELLAPGGWALSAGGLVTDGGVFCGGGFVAHGEVRLL